MICQQSVQKEIYTIGNIIGNIIGVKKNSAYEIDRHEDYDTGEEERERERRERESVCVSERSRREGDANKRDLV